MRELHLLRLIKLKNHVHEDEANEFLVVRFLQYLQHNQKTIMAQPHLIHHLQVVQKMYEHHANEE